MHTKVFSIQIFQYFRQIPPRVCTLALFIITMTCFLIKLHRILWDIFMIIILALNVLFVPVACSFFRELINIPWLIFTTTSDILFAMDIVLNFWTGFITTDNHVILDLKIIRKVYIRKWLLIDIISVIPFDFLTLVIVKFDSKATTESFAHTSTALRLLRLLKLLSMVKIFRVFKFIHYLAKWEEVNSIT